MLIKGLETEGLFKAYEHKAKYAHIFDYKRDMGTVTRQLRIALRPFVLAMSGSTDLARHLRKMGEAAGFTYPEEPAKVVMKGLTLSSTSSLPRTPPHSFLAHT